jgi:hypothetical protein
MQGPKWDPLQRATLKPHQDADMQACLDADVPKEVWMNRLYQVVVYPVPKVPGFEDWPEMVHLCIKRRDKSPARDWRHFQRIKNELVGPECEGVELYPAESRMVDTANQYHMFVLKGAANRFPFGFNERVVSEGNVIGSKQRPFERGFRPDDCVTETEESFKAKAQAALARKKQQMADIEAALEKVESDE